MQYIDFHTHAFPDELAVSTIPALEKIAQVKAILAGTTTELLSSMARANIGQSVVCSIATRPEHFQAILQWSTAIASAQLLPLASVHPASDHLSAEIAAIAQAGLKGIKLHPYHQEFYLDEERLDPIFTALERHNLFLVLHCGYDIGFPRQRRADPSQLLRLIKRFPRLKVVAAHLGAWQQWEEVEKTLLGRDIYLDTAFALQYLAPEQAKAILENHRSDRLLLGTDSPWADQAEVIGLLRGLNLSPKLLAKILYQNGHHLIQSSGQT